MAKISENSSKKDRIDIETAIKSGETHIISPKTGAKVHVNTIKNLKPIQKGETRNPSGRPQGAISKKNEQWAVLHESIAGIHTKRFNEVLSKLDDEKFMDNYLRIIEYFKPRLQRAENINMNAELDRVVLVASPDDIPQLPTNFDETEDVEHEDVPNTPD